MKKESTTKENQHFPEQSFYKINKYQSSSNNLKLLNKNQIIDVCVDLSKHEMTQEVELCEVESKNDINTNESMPTLECLDYFYSIKPTSPKVKSYKIKPLANINTNQYFEANIINKNSTIPHVLTKCIIYRILYSMLLTATTTNYDNKYVSPLLDLVNNDDIIKLNWPGSIKCGKIMISEIIELILSANINIDIKDIEKITKILDKLQIELLKACYYYELKIDLDDNDKMCLKLLIGIIKENFIELNRYIPDWFSSDREIELHSYITNKTLPKNDDETISKSFEFSFDHKVGIETRLSTIIEKSFDGTGLSNVSSKRINKINMEKQKNEVNSKYEINNIILNQPDILEFKDNKINKPPINVEKEGDIKLENDTENEFILEKDENEVELNKKSISIDNKSSFEISKSKLFSSNNLSSISDKQYNLIPKKNINKTALSLITASRIKKSMKMIETEALNLNLNESPLTIETRNQLLLIEKVNDELVIKNSKEINSIINEMKSLNPLWIQPINVGQTSIADLLEFIINTTAQNSENSISKELYENIVYEIDQLNYELLNFIIEEIEICRKNNQDFASLCYEILSNIIIDECSIARYLFNSLDTDNPNFTTKMLGKLFRNYLLDYMFIIKHETTSLSSEEYKSFDKNVTYKEATINLESCNLNKSPNDDDDDDNLKEDNIKIKLERQPDIIHTRKDILDTNEHYSVAEELLCKNGDTKPNSIELNEKEETDPETKSTESPEIKKNFACFPRCKKNQNKV